MPEVQYGENILNDLMDRYENSLLYQGRNQRRETISFSVNRTTLPEYFDEGSLQYETIHAQLTEMEQKNFVRLVWKNRRPGHILEKVVLCPDQTENIYRFLRRQPKSEKERELLQIREKWTGREKTMDDFLDWMEARIREGKSIRQYTDPDRPQELDQLCSHISAILSNQEDIFLREFSVRFWRDSKAAERELSRAAAVISRFSENEMLRELNAEQLLEEFGIYKNPSWVMMKGSGAFRMRGDGEQRKMFSAGLDLSDYPGGIGISSSDILRIQWDRSCLPQRVTTIENLTSFHRWQEDGTLAVYLGGYHNRIKRVFLQNLRQACEGAEVIFEHFGDIDCGGFQIWRNLCERTGIPFRTRGMDEETYFRCLEFGKELTANDRKELERMKEDPFYFRQKNLFSQMLAQGRKIEQECVGVPL